ncbi:DUF155-domain-containing protein [Sodiomyces alkalinus F11]|uniref:DUF155-domain-containing protein n=1 Tax=Sodiomyces alkalinus (strain CBS 110278 / VKM F-3762 / F11) TaxID=1314773 RepID=A0A3N2Q6R2_SODAK|nr:DUF155-domain-containing protein [Sodiomyces alkalinus F11]ROT42305.1 DUF155-domain-containing protein [Sodiomyces alkalinus F11]
MRFMSVDNVLQYASDIPSGQPRHAPRPSPPQRTALPMRPRRASSLTGVGAGLPHIQSRIGQQNIPSRTSKISQKLVLLPETIDERRSSDEEEPDSDAAKLAKRHEDDEGRPLNDDELEILKKKGGVRGKSYAERLPKFERKEKIARLTAYCTAQSYKMKSTGEFLRKKHGAKTKLYDDCLYAVYSLPLLPGSDGFRVRSRPIPKTPGSGKTLLDLEIERSERRDHYEGYFEDNAFTSGDGDGDGDGDGHRDGHRDGNGDGGDRGDGDGGATVNDHDTRSRDRDSDVSGGDETGDRIDRGADPSGSPQRDRSADERFLSPMGHIAPDTKAFAEVFLFSYGVVVFWNLTERQEKDILADLTFAENDAGQSLLTRPLEEDEFETEEFNFEYSADIKRPRIFNDMITLLPRSDHMIKLTISHAIAQSTKLCFFEERLNGTMLDAQHVPKRLALTGELGMTRAEIVKIMGRLFTSRVDINLSSNILDVPNFFWDSEPTLHPLYSAIREYLEIDTRTKMLNERCRDFLDLASILSDSVADYNMSHITWIIIVLIGISIVVTVAEVGIRFTLLSKHKNKSAGDLGAQMLLDASSLPQLDGPPTVSAADAGSGAMGRLAWELRERNVTLDEVRRWSRMLGQNEHERGYLCGSQIISQTYKGV